MPQMQPKKLAPASTDLRSSRSLQGHLTAWLAANRSRRCTVLPEPEFSTLAVGEAGTIVVRMAPGSHQDLGYLAESPQQPSHVARFLVNAQSAFDLGTEWKGEVSKTLNDVAGSPRVKLSWGPVATAGVYLITVRLGDRIIEGSPLRVRIRPALLTIPTTSTMHAASEDAALREGGPQRVFPRTKVPPLPPLSLVAGETGHFLVAARDEVREPYLDPQSTAGSYYP